MIFVAVGTQFPFDRLIRCVDEWAAAHHIAVVAQIAGGEYLPSHARYERFMTTEVFNQTLQAASVIISHAGMGNIITAIESSKPIIVMNRQYELGEHRNNHQADGLEWMAKLPGVYTAKTCEDLVALLNQHDTLQAAGGHVGNERQQSLIKFIDQTIRA
jgi:UDP-N-acetylglucosamine transferase subunit ALG13